MAGSKTFLQPILDETVGGIQEAVDDVVEVVTPMPSKIDEQIAALDDVVDKIEALQNLIGSTANALNVMPSTTGSHIIILGAEQEKTSKITATQFATVSCMCNGSVNLHFQLKTYSGARSAIFTLKRNGSSAYTKTLEQQTTYQVYDETFKVNKGDILTFFIASNSSDFNAWIKDVKLDYALFNPAESEPFIIS